MNKEERKNHWNTVFKTKNHNDVSWYQQVPQVSVDLIHEIALPKNAPIIDIGAGDSALIEILLNEGYTDLSVLDISAEAISKSQQRLAKKADKVHWITADITTFKSSKNYLLWHDRAAFHFMFEEDDRRNYILNAKEFIENKGYLIVGTFSQNGPEKCSSLPLNRYSEEELTATFEPHFTKDKCLLSVHTTPFNTSQEFTFCRLKKEPISEHKVL